MKLTEAEKIHGRGKCHICGKPKAKPGELYCSYPHARVPVEPIDPEKPDGFWSWKLPTSGEGVK